ncbi:AMP-dependent synthetase and ligase [Caballeronia choica]|uniref:AMP-dependent synthetase and ligase n=1 Tax=Caballeronia choica TaxID=326476 RepID=A0A158K5D7_9BURK|nr:AMP-binding protein [Caballeronia choica]SAL76332.1 AMP-dependent synthetase and ligase [Caballeronia choica]
MIVGDILRRNAFLYGERPAVICNGRAVTHADFLERTLRLAQGLRSKGLQRQSRIAILAQNAPEYLELYGACEEAGFVAVGLNYRLSDAELTDILIDATPAVLAYDEEFAKRVDAIISGLGEPVQLLEIGGDADSEFAYERLIENSLPEENAPRADEEDTVCIFYTSGTTGRPKGAMLPNGGQAAQAEIYARAVKAKATDRMLIVMPLFHCGGKNLEMMYRSQGAAIVLHKSFNPQSIIASFLEDGVTAAHLAPVMIHQIIDELDKAPKKFPLLHTVHYASAPMSVALLKRAIGHFGLVFVQSYGMTENGAGTFLDKFQHVLEGPETEVARLASAGKPFEDTELRVVNDDGSEAEIGTIGEVLTRAPGMMSGYWKNPTSTAQALKDGWMCTGDLGYLDKEGYLFIVDRKKDMIISGGENIYSREVEEALASHPSVSEASVIGVPDSKWGEAVKAFVVLRTNAVATEVELIDYVKSKIASYKKPKSIDFVGSLPRLSSTNKVDKKALRAPFWAGKERSVA